MDHVIIITYHHVTETWLHVIVSNICRLYLIMRCLPSRIFPSVLRIANKRTVSGITANIHVEDRYRVITHESLYRLLAQESEEIFKKTVHLGVDRI